MKAIIGSWDHRPYQLLAEITALRGRVRDLENALARAEEENATLRARLREQAIDLDELAGVEVVSDAEHADRVELGA
jgi:hypothetical protein